MKAIPLTTLYHHPTSHLQTALKQLLYLKNVWLLKFYKQLTKRTKQSKNKPLVFNSIFIKQALTSFAVALKCTSNGYVCLMVAFYGLMKKPVETFLFF